MIVRFPCSEHMNYELSLYCLTCKQFVCKICVGSTHRTHKYNKNLANKLLTQFESYYQSRNQVLNSKYNKTINEKLKDLDTQLNEYLIKEETELKNAVDDSILKFRQQIYKDYHSNTSKQNKILEQIRKKVKELKSISSLEQKAKLNNEIKSFIQDVKRKKYLVEFDQYQYENCLSPKTIKIPLLFTLDYPFHNDSFLKCIFLENNGLTMVFKIFTIKRERHSNIISFSIKILQIEKPLPVVWGIVIESENQKKHEFLNYKFTFDQKTESSFQSSNETSIVLSTDINEFIENYVKFNPNERNKATVNITLFLRYLYFNKELSV